MRWLPATTSNRGADYGNLVEDAQLVRVILAHRVRTLGYDQVVVFLGQL